MTSTIGESLLDSLAHDHERVHLIQDADCGLRAVIAIHSTALGPALGGLRMRAYQQGLAEALDDALKLSRAMTFKAAAAGLELGGGKAVVIDDGDRGARPGRLIALAREIERLEGAYITAEDVGTTTADMDLIAEYTDYVVGRSVHDGVGGDPSWDTARTVLGSIRAALATLEGDDQLQGRAVGVIGLGKVGGPLAHSLLRAGAQVVGYDAVPAVAAQFGAEGVELLDSAQEVLTHDLDVLAPCAIGGMIDPRAASQLHCRIICGSANNPLAGEETAAMLARRDILYVPDFMANCGGLIHVDAERRGDADPAHVEQALAAACDRTRDVLIEARASGRLPSQIAEEHARARIERARAGIEKGPRLTGAMRRRRAYARAAA